MKNEIIMELVKMLVSNTKSEGSTEGSTDCTTQSKYPIGQKVILRGYNAGVIFGELVSVIDWVYRMKNARRLYYWKTNRGIALEDVSVYGINTAESKITTTVPLCDVTDTNVSLLLPCSAEAIKSIESAKDYVV